MPRTKPSNSSYDPLSLLDRTEVMETEHGMLHFYASDSQRGEESLDQDSQGNSALVLMLGGLELGDTVYDIGCRSGLHSLAFAKTVGPKGKVMCFEHDLLQLFMAHMNLADHGLEACVQFLPIVASDQIGLRRYNRFDLQNNELDPSNGIDDLSGSGLCIAMPLDQLGDHKSPQLIRIGPMGLELAALKGMQRLLLDAQPRIFVSPESPKSHDEIALYLSQIGYDVYGFSPRFKNKRSHKGTSDEQNLDPQDFNLYGILPRIHRAPSQLPRLMKAQETNFRSQLAIAEERESSGPYFEVDLDADSNKGVANVHFAYWAWQSLRNELRTFAKTFLQSALGQLSPETYGELTRQAVDFVSSETPAGEYEALRSLLFQAMKSIRRAMEHGQKLKAETGALEEKLTIQASELSKLSYQLTQASINRGNSDIELERVQLEKENLHAQIEQLQQSLLELTSQLLLAKENEASSLENLAASDTRASAELLSISKAYKQEIAHLESKMTSMEAEKADLHARTERLTESLGEANSTKAQEALAAQMLASAQASQIEQLGVKLVEMQEQETLFLQARKELSEALQQKEAELEGAKAGFDFSVKRLMEDQTRITLLGRVAEDKVTDLNRALEAEIQAKASIQSICSELDETLQQKEAELESVKARLDAELEKLLQDHDEINLQRKTAEDKVTDLNRALEAEIQAKASIQSICYELNSQIGELTTELTTLNDREVVLTQAQRDLVEAQARNKALTDEVDTLRSKIQEMELFAQNALLELKDNYSAHVPPQQYQTLLLQNEDLRKSIGAMNAELEARDMMVSDLTDLVRLQAAQLDRQAI